MDAVPDILVRVLGLGSISVVNEPKAAPVERQWDLEYPAVGVIFAVAAGFVFILSRLCVHPTLVNPSGASRLFGLETLAEVPLDSLVTKGFIKTALTVLPTGSSMRFSGCRRFCLSPLPCQMRGRQR